MSKVYVPQIPSRFDQASRLWIPTMRLDAAEKFGSVVVMLPPDAARAGAQQCVDAMAAKMADFTAEDWLVCIGDPALIGAASCLAARAVGGHLRMLKWDRIQHSYLPMEFRV